MNREIAFESEGPFAVSRTVEPAHERILLEPEGPFELPATGEGEAPELEGLEFEHEVQPLGSTPRDYSLKDIGDSDRLPDEIRAAILRDGETKVLDLADRAFWIRHPDMRGHTLEKTGERHRALRQEYGATAHQVRALIWLRQIIDELDKHRGDIPREFLLGWMAVESDGRVGVVTSRPERGYFQIDWLGGEAREELGLSAAQFSKLSTDRAFSIEKGVELVRRYRQWILDHYPAVPDQSELLWRLTKGRHAASGALKGVLDALVSRKADITWENVSGQVPGFLRNNVDTTLTYAGRLKPFADLVGSAAAGAPQPEVYGESAPWIGEDREDRLAGESFEQEEPHVQFESYEPSRENFDEVLSAAGEAGEFEQPVPTTLRMRPKRIEGRILWPALGFPAVIAPRSSGSADPLEGDPSRCICALILSNQRFLSKEEAAQYLRIVPWSERGRRNIPSGQAGSFDVADIQVRNDDGGKKLVWPNKDEHGDAVVFGGSRSLSPDANPEENSIVVSLSRHVREFYKKNGLEHLHEIRVSEAASNKLADGQYHLFWNNDAAGANESSDEMKLLLERFARPRRRLGSKWASLAESFVDEYRFDYGALHPPYQQGDPQKRLTEVLHPVFVNRESGPLRICHITDTHVHVRADVYEANLSAAGKLSGVSYNNFNRSFAEIYGEGKQQSDMLLITGDLIDYGRGHVGLAFGGRYRNALGQDDAYHADRNWILFYYLLASGQNYTRPTYTILGNHDWRLNPYPPFAPGAPDAGAFIHNAGSFSDGQLTELMKVAHGPGHERKFSYALSAESTLGLVFKHPLAAVNALAGKLDVDGSPVQTNIDSVIWYLLLLNPFLDYSVKLPAGQQLLMLDWGQNEEVMNFDEPRTFMEFGQRAAKSLTPLQKWHVEQFVNLPGRSKVIGMHAPPIGPYPRWSDSDLAKGVKDYGPREDSRVRTPDGKIVKLTSHTLFAIRPKDQPFGIAADYGSFIQERDWFIQRVGDPRLGVRLILTGHIHRNGLFVVSAPARDRSLRLIHTVSYAGVRGVRPPAVATKPETGNTYLEPLYVNTTSAGPRGNRWEQGHSYVSPGYAIITLAGDGTIAGVASRQIVPAPARAPVAVR